MNHPLTDDTCNELSIFPIKALDDKYAGLMMADMRAAADWQLEQVIKWLGKNLDYSEYNALGYSVDIDAVISDLKEAMRPQEDN